MNSSFSNLTIVSLLMSGSCYAEPDLQLSGYVFNTSFSESSWYTSRTVGAVNVDLNTDLVSFRSQVAATNNGDAFIRRATIEKDALLFDKLEAVVKVGRFPRLSSFYDSVTDSPASIGMALLPQAGYNYRMYTGAFVLMDGVQSSVSYAGPRARTSVILSYGKMYVPVQKDLVQELFKREVADIELTPQNAYDIAIHHEREALHAYISSSRYNAVLTPTRVTATTTVLENTYKTAWYTLNKIGLKWDANDWYVQTEYIAGYTRAYNRANTRTTSTVDARDSNYVVGYRFRDNHSIYSSFSTGINKTNSTQSIDRVVGYTAVLNPTTVSIEYHKGFSEGGSWRKYGSAITNWNSFVVSATYQF